MIGLNQTEKVSQNPVVTLGARKRKAPSHYADHVIEIKKVPLPLLRLVIQASARSKIVMCYRSSHTIPIDLVPRKLAT